MPDEQRNRTTTRAALADLAEVQRKLIDPDTPKADHDDAQRDLPALLRAARAALELHADPDPPEPVAVEPLADPANVTAALDAPDPPGAAQYLADLALRSGAPVAGPEALRQVLRLGHRDEAAPADLVEIADRELRRRERAARRAERLALLDADVDDSDGGKLARERLRGARTRGGVTGTWRRRPARLLRPRGVVGHHP